MKNHSTKKFLLPFLAIVSLTTSVALAQTAPENGDGGSTATPQVITLTNKDGIGFNDGITKYIPVGLDQELEINVDNVIIEQAAISDELYNKNEFNDSNVERILTLTGENIINSELRHMFPMQLVDHTHSWHFKPKALGFASVYIHVEGLSNKHNLDLCFPIQVVPAATSPSQQ